MHNPRHEQFAQLVVSGKTPAEAYVAAGYAERTAYTCGPRLLEIASVRARVAELQQTVAQAAATGDLAGLSDEQIANFRRAIAKLAKMPGRIEGSQEDRGFGGDASDSEQGSNDSSASAAVVDVAPAAEIAVPRQPERIAGNRAPASRQLAAAGNNGGGGAVAGEPERIEAPKVDVADDENSLAERSSERPVDVTVSKIPASDLPVQRASWLPIWRKLAPQHESDPATFSDEMARLAPGCEPKPAFWRLSLEAQAAALDERFPLGK